MRGRLRKIIVDQGGYLKIFRKSLASPTIALKAVIRIVKSNWVSLLFPESAAWDTYVWELHSHGFLDDRLNILHSRFSNLTMSQVRGRPVVAGGMRTLHAELLYALIRERKPAVVVETGVCNGVSSSVILKAMQKNQRGQLVSIDLPEFSDPNLNEHVFWEGKGGAVIPAGEQPGWLVPVELRGSWRLELGRCQELLEPLLKETGPVDIFIHDSEHSYDNQLFEFTKGFEALKKGGVLIATDINWSNAFDVFWRQAKGVGAKCAFVDPSCAVVIKTK